MDGGPQRPRLPRTRTSAGVWLLVAMPAVMILTCGILILVYRKSVFDVVIGLLVVIFCGTIGAGAALTIVGIRRDQKLAALQIDFVSKVSHELKTPLTSIRMFVETLKLGRVQDPAKVAQCLEIIGKETERLSGLIGRLLSWGTMEAGAYKVELVPRTPEELINAALQAFEPQAIAGGAKVEVTIEPGLPKVQADKDAMVDAVLNLLNNALRYGGEDKRILVRASRRDGQIALEVQDKGIGIDLKHQRRIFERFYRADERYSRAQGGTGLGLAITRHIVVVHGGSISVNSRPGEGSTFTILLPLAPEAATAAEPGSQAPRSEAGAA